MLPILEFIFSDFWHWLGAFLLLALATGGLGRWGAGLWAAAVAWSGKRVTRDYD